MKHTIGERIEAIRSSKNWNFAALALLDSLIEKAVDLDIYDKTDAPFLKWVQLHTYVLKELLYIIGSIPNGNFIVLGAMSLVFLPIYFLIVRH